MDAVREYLVNRRVGPHVIDGGLDYLVAAWTRIASRAEEREATWYSEEWLNDLDTREILQGLFDHVPASRTALAAVKDADLRFRAAAIESDECQWGAGNANQNGWTHEKNWWYWREPPTGYLSATVG